MTVRRGIKSFIGVIDGIRPYRVFDRPLFVISAPRSGSTFLFDMLSRFKESWAAPVEMDEVWWSLFPYDRSDPPSDYVGAAEHTGRSGQRLRRGLYRYTVWMRQARDLGCDFVDRLALRPVRYVDKTIANCFHIEFLERVFPDARYLYLLRDGRATISSMMEGWTDPRFGKQALQRCIDQMGHTMQWAYPAPPHWRDQLGRPLEEVCAWSWCEHVRTAARQLADVPADRKMIVRYEDVLAAPRESAARIAAFCQLSWSPAVTEFVNARPLSRTTVSAPTPDKWRRLHRDAIGRILPTISDMMATLGYAVD